MVGLVYIGSGIESETEGPTVEGIDVSGLPEFANVDYEVTNIEYIPDGPNGECNEDDIDVIGKILLSH